jgi:methylthioribose-1-phosphate isomerase
VAAPVSTVDPGTPNGDLVEIEERDPAEVTHLAGRPLAPPGTLAGNPAFDITPAALVTGLVTERGVLREPDRASLARVLATGSG